MTAVCDRARVLSTCGLYRFVLGPGRGRGEGRGGRQHCKSPVRAGQLTTKIMPATVLRETTNVLGALPSALVLSTGIGAAQLRWTQTTDAAAQRSAEGLAIAELTRVPEV